MADANWVQSGFSAGEWSPYAQGRITDPLYRQAMNVCRNGHPIEEGAWLRRSGTQFSATTRGGTKGRLIKFDFEAVAAYFVEATDGFLRFHGVSSQTGGLTTALPADFQVSTTNDNQQVASISTANPAVVQTAGAHGWTTGNQVIFLFDTVTASNQTPLLLNRQFKINVVDATHFSIMDAITGATIDGNTIGWSIASAPAGSVVVARIQELASPWSSGSWLSLRSIQAETEAVLVNGAVAPQILSVATLPSATAFAQFALNSASFQDGPYLDPPIDGTTITPGAASGTGVTLTASAITSINGGAGFKTTDVGRLIRLLSEPAAWAVGTTYAQGDYVKYGGVYFVSLQGSNIANQPDAAAAYWGITTASTAYTWSWATITSWTSTTAVKATINGNALVNTNAMPTWRLGVYSASSGYPSCGVYDGGRIWLSGAVANRVDASVTNGISGNTINMAPTAADGTVADNNGISYIFNARDVNPIFWMISTNAGIACGTLAAEWLISAPTTGPITPTNIAARPVTSYGGANVEPEYCELTIAFVQRFNRKVLEYFPDVFSGRFTAPNLSKNAKHLTTAGIQEIRYQQELAPIIWARCGDGSLIGCIYKRSNLFSSQGPELMGWHRHDLGGGRLLESIATGPSADGTIDTLAMLTNDSATGIRHVGQMMPLFDINATMLNAWFLDDATHSMSGAVTLINGAWMLTLYGLWHLNGKTVSACIGGLDCGDFTVTNGSIAVPIDADLANPDALSVQYLMSISSATAYSPQGVTIVKGSQSFTVPAIVGFTYTSQGQVLRPDTPEQSHSQTGPGLGKPRRQSQLAILMQSTQGVSFGTSFSKMRKAMLKSPGGTVALHNLQLFSGVYRQTIDDSWSYDSMTAWQITRPYPCAVVSVGPFQNMSD